MGGPGTGIEGTVVMYSETGFDDPAVREPLEDYLAEIDDLEDVTVTSPFVGGAGRPGARRWCSG